MNDAEFFAQLLAKTEKKYRESPIGKNAKLAYSITATPLRRGKPLILGINWGGSGAGFESQDRMPTPYDLTTEKIRGDYKFLERSRGYFKKYSQLEMDLDQVDFNYANLCFFRSRAEKDLTYTDYEYSYPLAKELIKYLEPKHILVFGVTALNRIKELGNGDLTTTNEFVDSDNKHRGFKGKFLGFDFFCLPHPNARVKSASRDELWEKVFATS
jgi:hypothetical protein